MKARDVATSGWGILLAILATDVRAEETKFAGKGIDPITVAAYEKLGGKYGGWLMHDGPFLVGRENAEKGLPGFRLRALPTTKLPDVGQRFGLDLSFSGIEDVRLKELAHLKNLTALNLYATRVTDAGLRELAPLQNLDKLSLICLNVTDTGLRSLASLKNLTSLNLLATNVTSTGVAKLRKELPGCAICR